ncbi:XdhC family protein [Allostreptomyces psammosilenae]|uniref:Xanthine dehydrogenase accessory factor n=1 Tax=Allostreptomyces psammosilenae TaxID=1892865 RepID=A0A853A669_9ACTN|nr:XdhC/CoxI family protein [Allostreptomyces psammosilenae]NYI08344.1 xanthine dehydrogenase accessory factor [Allostreptomyces psammosilenae]
MLDIARDLVHWWDRGRPFAVATVVGTSGSAPRDPGAALAVHQDGTAIGSVSGGCVEGAVYELCREAMDTGRPARARFGFSDEDAFAVGLSCGGVIEVFVQPVRPEPSVDGGAAGEVGEAAPVLRAWAGQVAAGRPAALARVVDGPAALLGRALLLRPATGPGPTDDPEPPAPSAAVTEGAEASWGAFRVTGTLGSPVLDRAAAGHAAALLDRGGADTARIPLPPDVASDGGAGPAAEGDSPECGPTLTLLVETAVPAPRMLVYGAVDFAAAMVRAGRLLGFAVTVCDARPVFATRARFPEADEVVVDWPHRHLAALADRPGALDGRTAVVVLTHDAKFDVPLLETALRLPVGYVGAMGSRRTHGQRVAALREAGLSPAELDRLRSPIGLDLGARTPEETAVAIAAEIVADRRGGSGRPLSATDGPIHPDPPRPHRRPAAALEVRSPA